MLRFPRLSKNLRVASEGSQALRFYIENRRHVRRFSRFSFEAGHYAQLTQLIACNEQVQPAPL